MSIMGNIFVVTNVEIQKDHGNQILTSIKDLSEQQRLDFCVMIDELILDSDGDDELKEGLEYLDKQAFYYDISFYDLILHLYEEAEIKAHIKDWRNRNF